MRLRTRAARFKDVFPVFRIIDEILASPEVVETLPTGPDSIATLWTFRNEVRRAIVGNSAMLVSNRENGIVGFGSYVFVKGEKISEWVGRSVADRVMYLSGALVLPEIQRQGVGSLLLQKRLDIAQATGVQEVYASCWGGGGSRSLLEKNGFSLVREDDHYFPGSVPHAIMMVTL